MAQPSREQITQEFQKYFPKRQISEQDYLNVENRGLGLVSKMYGSITPASPEGREIKTVQEQGAAASTTPLSTEEQYSKATTDLLQATDTRTNFMTLLRQGLEMKQRKQAPYEQAINKQETKLRELAMQPGKIDLKNLTPQDALQAIAARASNIRGNIDKLKTQYGQEQQTLTEILQQANDSVNDQIVGLGIRVDLLAAAKSEQYQQEQAAISLAFSPQTLLSGVMPPGVPENLIPAWEAQSNAAKEAEAYARAQAARSGRGGGSGAASMMDTEALYWANLISTGQATLTDVPTTGGMRNAVAGLMSQYGVTTPEEVGAYPTYDQWIAQNFSNMSVDPNDPAFVQQYQSDYQNYLSTKNSLFGQLFSGTFAGQGAATGGTESSLTPPSLEGEW